MRIPTVRLKHKRKGYFLVVNQSDWAQDLGKYQYRDFERVGERHNEAEAPVQVAAARETTNGRYISSPAPTRQATARQKARRPARAPNNDG